MALQPRQLIAVSFMLVLAVAAGGCRSKQHAHVLSPDDQDMVGSHVAGAETWKPLITTAVGQLLGRHTTEVTPVSHIDGQIPKRRICFVCVENRSSEEIGDFKEQIYEHIDSMITGSEVYAPVSRRFVEAGLRETRLRPDQLFLPANRRRFTDALEQMDQPFDYLLYAKITSGTTQSNSSYQRDYLLTLEMVNVQTGDYDKESATLRKGYHKSVFGKLKHYR